MPVEGEWEQMKIRPKATGMWMLGGAGARRATVPTVSGKLSPAPSVN